MLTCTDTALDRPMILFQDVVEILHRSMSTVLPQNTVGFEFNDGWRISSVLVAIDYPRRGMVLPAQGLVVCRYFSGQMPPFFYAPTDNWLRPDHFAQRLTPAKVQAIISRVIRNAESVNADPSRDFIIESLGIFGSVLADATSPATSMLSLPHGGVPTTAPCPRLHIILLTSVNQPTAFHAHSHAGAEEWT